MRANCRCVQVPREAPRAVAPSKHRCHEGCGPAARLAAGVCPLRLCRLWRGLLLLQGATLGCGCGVCWCGTKAIVAGSLCDLSACEIDCLLDHSIT